MAVGFRLSYHADSAVPAYIIAMPPTAYACDLAAIRAAAERIKGIVHRTPVVTSETFDRLAGRRVYFKCENLQKVGAFKYRGATNAVLRLSDAEAARGVVTHSSGNHAQALALAARVRGIPAYIVMPRTAPAVKKAAVEGYGGRITLCEPTLAAREETAARLVKETGATLIPPFDHPDVIAGQGTAALELLEEVPDLDAVVVQVGGGGQIAGWCIAAKGVKPAIRVFGAEPAGADDAARSKVKGKWVPQTSPNTIADGLLTSTGELTWPVIRDLVERIITVTDDEIRSTMRFVWERMKLVVEPSGVVGAAAVLADEFKRMEGISKVGVVFSGGNVSLDKLYW
jgi:threonine dehydratase